MIRYITAGESHGQSLTAIIEGLPAGLSIDEEYINRHLARRQVGYGRGERMNIEKDKVQITSGVRWGETIASPVALIVNNKDWENWGSTMSVDSSGKNPDEHLLKPRPGHADLPGILKYDREDVRDILERASARETAARVAAGAFALRLLEEFDIKVFSYSVKIGNAGLENLEVTSKDIDLIEASALRCPSPEVEKIMIEEIDTVQKNKDTLGGIFTVRVEGLPPGLGSHVQWDRKLDARIAAAILSIQAIKGVEFGIGFKSATLPGSKVHDEISYEKQEKKYYRKTNNAGGIEGGMTNGEPLIITAAMKPISSLMKPLKSVNTITKEPVASEKVRSDVCALPAAGVVGEAAVALELASALMEKTGGDSIREMKRNYKAYLDQVRNF
ncbi:MAG: chorismate synthase [Elusimicrobia bacterium]|nr:chorismate synthase [Elusimicrobiota bacterium]